MLGRWFDTLRRFRSLGRAERYRVVGTILLIVGGIVAVTYWVTAPAPPPSLDDLPGYAKANARQLRIMMGQTGVLLDEWRTFLEQPAARAGLIALGFAATAGCFFRLAWVLDEEARDRLRESGETPPHPH